MVTAAFYGLTVEKIAEQVGNDVNFLTGTVKPRLAYGLAALRRAMASP